MPIKSYIILAFEQRRQNIGSHAKDLAFIRKYNRFNISDRAPFFFYYLGLSTAIHPIDFVSKQHFLL